MSNAREALTSSRSVEWYTPAEIVKVARDTMGGIDLDPASCEVANRIVCARHFYTAEEDGLKQPWAGRVWLNPPYGRGGQGTWSGRLRCCYNSQQVTEACLLVNAVTDCKWFQPLWEYPICFIAGRVKFWGPERGATDSPTHGSALVYFGSNREAFARLAAPLGRVVLP